MARPVLTLALALALLLVSVEGAVFTFIASGSTITATGGALAFTGPHTVLNLNNVILNDATIDVTNLLSANVQLCTFTNVAFTAETTGLSGDPVADPLRELVFIDNTFTFTTGALPLGNPYYAAAPRSWTAKLTVTNFFLTPPPPGYGLHLDGFATGVLQATPGSWAQIEDRSAQTDIAIVPNLGLWIEGADASSTLAIIDHYVTGHGGSVCTATDQSAVFALSQLNTLSYAFVDPGVPAPASGDVRYNNVVCNGNGDCDACVTAPTGTPPSVAVGRWTRAWLAYNPATGDIDVTVQVEDRNSDAVTISVVAFDTDVQTTIAAALSATNPQCMNRDTYVDDVNLHSADPLTGRFAAAAGSIWTLDTGAPTTIVVDSQNLNIQTYVAHLSMGELAACADPNAPPSNTQVGITFFVTHTALLDNAAVRVMDQNTQEFAMFWASQFSVSIGGTGCGTGGTCTTGINVVNPADFRIVAREPTLTPDPAGYNEFQLEIYTPIATGSDVVQRFTGNTLTTTQVENPGTQCLLNDGSTVLCETTLSFEITPQCSTLGDGVYPDTAYCYQIITIRTDQPYPYVLLPTGFPIELYDNNGAGGLVSSAVVSALLDFFQSTTEIEGVDTNGLALIAESFAGGDGIYPHTSLGTNKATTPNYTAGERICFKFTISGIDYDTTRWDKFGLDVTYGVYCALDQANTFGITEFPPYTFGQRQVSGCNAFVPVPVQRVNFLDAFSSSCRVPQTGTPTEQRFLCEDGHDVTMLDNQHILGSCDTPTAPGDADAHCLIPSQTLGLDANLAGANSCAGGTCFNGGDGASASPYKTNEVLGAESSWNSGSCRSVGSLTTIVPCDSSAPLLDPLHPATACHEPLECSRPVHTIMLCMDAPLITFGLLGVPAAVTFNFDLIMHLTSSTGVITSRRLLSVAVADPRTNTRDLLSTVSTGDNQATAAQVTLGVTCATPGHIALTPLNGGAAYCGFPGSQAVNTNTGIGSGTSGATLRSASGAAIGGAEITTQTNTKTGTDSFEVDAGTGAAATQAASGQTQSALNNTAYLAGALGVLVVGALLLAKFANGRIKAARGVRKEGAELLEHAAAPGTLADEAANGTP
jgi:hypothetical protein